MPFLQTLALRYEMATFETDALVRIGGTAARTALEQLAARDETWRARYARMG